MVRYCVPCSVETGKLTPRVAPSLEKKRETSKAKSQAKSQKNAARKRAAERSRTYVRLFDAAGREIEFDPIVAAKKIWREAGYQVSPSITWNRRKWGTSGHGGSFKVHFSIGNKDASLEDFIMLALHEGAHAEVGGHHGHDKIWRQAYADGAKKYVGAVFHMAGIRHRYDDMDPYVTEAAEDRSRKSKTPLIGRKVREKTAA